MGHTVVLGGGALGLTAALRLAQQGERVTVLEREPLPGGLAAGFRVGNAWLEKFYHHIFRSDTTIVRLIEELGLGAKLCWPVPKNPTLYGGKLHRLDSPLTLLTFKPLRLDERVRMGAALAWLRFLPPWGMEGKTATPWIRKWMGEGPYRVMWEPVLRSKFGALADEISLPWFWARIHDRSIALGYLRGGFQQLYDRLAEESHRHGADLRFGTEVQQVEQRPDGGFRVTHTEGVVEADRVVSTLPQRVTMRLMPALPDWYRQRYDWGQAYGAHCLILAVDRQVTDGYWININDPGYPFMVMVEHTNYMPPEDYGGRHLIYLGNYRPMDDRLMSMSKEEVLAEFLPAVARINPEFRPEWVTESWMFHAPYAQPIVTTEFKAHRPPFRTPVRGLYQASMFQIYPHDRGQNYSIELGERIARVVLKDAVG